MPLSRFIRALIGLGTGVYVLLPFLFAALGLLVTFGVPLWLAFSEWQRGAPPTLVVFPLFIFGLTAPVQCLLVPLHFLLTGVYLVHLVKNNVALEVYRILLALGLVFAPVIAMPIYFFLYIWPDTPPAWALEPTRSP